MKKIILALSVAIVLTLSVAVSLNGDATKFTEVEATYVNESLQPYFDEIVQIYKDNDVPIDYSKLDFVVPINMYGLQGYSNDGGIYIRTNQQYYKNIGLEKEIIMLVIAHELAHNQGIEHNDDIDSLMFPSDKFIPSLLEKYSVEELIVAVYK